MSACKCETKQGNLAVSGTEVTLSKQYTRRAGYINSMFLKKKPKTYESVTSLYYLYKHLLITLKGWTSIPSDSN